MLQTFDCPKCGAPVTYARQDYPSQIDTTVRCQYCNSSLLVPDELRGRPARVVPVTIDLRSITRQKPGRWIWLLVAIPLFIALVVVLSLVGVLAPIFYSITRDGNSPTTSRSLRPNEKSTGDGFARAVLTFGSEGIGPGMFTDARSIAVDGAGRIYVGEYTGGRIQVFDPAGKFLTQWSIGDRKTILRGLAADRKGTVYVAQGGNIQRYDGETGNSLGKLPYGDWGFDDVATAADGGLLAAWYKNRDDIVRFNAKGQAVKTIPAAVSSTSGDSELNTRVAIDGHGNIYALGTFNNAVFKFTPEGKFVNRFGGAGDKPGQLRAPGAIAVDGKSRVYVSDIKGIQVFDADGRYLTVFKPQGSASGMVFNDTNELFVAARNQVVKFSIKGD